MPRLLRDHLHVQLMLLRLFCRMVITGQPATTPPMQCCVKLRLRNPQRLLTQQPPAQSRTGRQTSSLKKFLRGLRKTIVNFHCLSLNEMEFILGYITSPTSLCGTSAISSGNAWQKPFNHRRHKRYYGLAVLNAVYNGHDLKKVSAFTGTTGAGHRLVTVLVEQHICIMSPRRDTSWVA